jgi:replicative DNA helicase
MHSYELEQQVIAGLLNHPSSYNSISYVIFKSDFVSEVNKVIFTFIQNSYEKGEKLDSVLLAEKIALSGIGFKDNINVSDYIYSLTLRQCSANSTETSAKALKKLSIRREISEMGSSLSKAMDKISPDASYSEIVETADSIYNKNLSSYENQDSQPKNIFDEMKGFIEDRGENPITEFGPMGPHPRVNELFGSLLRPGNITTIVARSGVGKTQFVMDFCTKVSLQHNIPVLHLDNGEMSKEELITRQCAALSGVPVRLLETGQWVRSSQEIVDKVRAVWKIVKNYQFYYENVGGMPVDTMIQKVKHFYYSTVGRGNPMILSFDYIKTTSEDMKNKSEWQVVGEMVDKFKRLIMKDIVHDDRPQLALITSVQSNRTGITNNRRSDSLVEDESIVSLSDRITQFSSHLFGLRQKTIDELAEEEGFGSHKLTCFKYRHLGENVHRATQNVRMPSGDLKKNFINLDIKNFNITEVGDLQDMVDSQVSAELRTENDQHMDLI